MLRNMSSSLFQHERIRTTLAKAKELRPFAEKLVTLSKRESLHARRQVLRHIHDRAVVTKLFDTISARYAQRPGGYTRILKLGPRRGDHAEMALIELVGSEAEAVAPEAPKPKKKRSRKSAPKPAKPAKKKPAKATKKKPARKKAGASKAGATSKKATKKKSKKA